MVLDSRGSARPRGCAALGVLALVAACAGPAPDGALIADPYEPVNRAVHVVNKGLDTVILRPVSYAYDALAPELLQFLVTNAASHLTLPATAANHLLQGSPMRALSMAGRFGLNTVFGAAGMLDPATEFGLPIDPADFGQTLHVWGVREGAYVELLLFGPSTERDTIGRVVDVLLTPTTYITAGPVQDVALGLQGGSLLDQRASNGTEIDRLLYESEDSYVALRSTYVQLRRARVAGASGPDAGEAALPDIFEDLPEDAPASPTP